MEKDILNTERAYTTSEVSKMLDMPIPTVRKYSQELEKQNYQFAKGKVTGKHQARLYTEKDITALRYFKELREGSNIKVEQAATLIADKLGGSTIQDVSSDDTTEIVQYKEQYNELKELLHKQNEMIEKQTEVIKELSKRLDQQQQYIDERMIKRDQALLQALDERLETQKQIAAATEEKKGFFAKLFGK